MDSALQLKIIHVNGLIGILLNIVLIYIVTTDQSLPSKSYKKLLTLIGVYHICFSVVSWVVKLRCLYDEHGYMCFSDGFREFGYWYSYGGVLVYGFFYVQSLGLFAVHCTYRFTAITGKHTYLFTEWYGVVIVTCVSLSFSALYTLALAAIPPSPVRTSLSRHDIVEIYNVSIDSLSYIGTVFKWPDENGVPRYNVQPLCSTAVCFGLVGMLYISSCIMGRKIYKFVKYEVSTDSARHLQLQLYRLLVAQGTAPLLFEFSPALLVFVGGETGYFPKKYAMLISVFVSVYPAADALMILLLFKAFRTRILWPIYLKLNRNKVSFSVMSTTRTTEPFYEQIRRINNQSIAQDGPTRYESTQPEVQ